MVEKVLSLLTWGILLEKAQGEGFTAEQWDCRGEQQQLNLPFLRGVPVLPWQERGRVLPLNNLLPVGTGHRAAEQAVCKHLGANPRVAGEWQSCSHQPVCHLDKPFGKLLTPNGATEHCHCSWDCSAWTAAGSRDGMG